jgi:iron complex outermembrane recepter protein
MRYVGAADRRSLCSASTFPPTEYAALRLVGAQGDHLFAAYGASRLLLIALLAVLLAAELPPCSVALAQPTAPPPSGPTGGAIEVARFLKEETVVTAIRHEQPISEAPSNVYVITEEDIRHSGATDVPTLLRRIPGIEVIQMTAAHFDVSARGDDQPRANKMLVLVDGRSIYLDEQGEVLWKMIPVTLAEIKQIEVLKGPASALYGFNAFDGVINIITKSPEEMAGATLQFGGGELDTFTGSAIAAGRSGRLGYRLSFGWDQNDQWQNRNALAFRAYKFNIYTDYALSNLSKLSFSGGLVDADHYAGPIVDIINASQEPTLGYANVAYERPNFFLRVYWTGFDQPAEIGVNPLLTPIFRVSDRRGSSQRSLTVNTYNIEAQHTLEFGTTNRLTYGINYRNNAVSSNFLDEFTREERLGLYLQDEWHFMRTLTAVAGLRYDLHTEISPTISPRFALLYQPAPNHTFRAAVSVAYRPPTIFETHNESYGELFFVPPPFNRTALFGSRSLDPEQIVSYDAGYQGWFFRHRLRLRADFFFNCISDLIISSVPTSRPGVLTFANEKNANIYGGEVGGEFQITPWLGGFANYAYQQIDQSFRGEARRGGPRSKVNAGVRGEWDNGLSGEATIDYVGAATYPLNPFLTLEPSPLRERVGDYTLLNLRGAYRFWNERAEVAIAVFNTLNDRHREHPLGDIIGSRVMGWLTIKY